MEIRKVPLIIYLTDHQKYLGSSGRVKQRQAKGQSRKQNMQLQKNNTELKACHEIHAVQLLLFGESLLFAKKRIIAKVIAEGDSFSYWEIIFWSKGNFKDIMEKTFDKGPICSSGSRKDNPLADFYVARIARSVAS